MNIAILGAAGQNARFLIPMLLSDTNSVLTLVARRAESRLLDFSGIDRVKIVDADLTDVETMTAILKNQDFVYLNDTHGDVVQSTINAMDAAGSERLVIAGVHGVLNEMYGAYLDWNRSMISNPDAWMKENEENYLAVAKSDLDYTYIRQPWLYSQTDKRQYRVLTEDEPWQGTQISRSAVARFVLDLVKNPSSYIRQAPGVIEPGTENFSKPSFY